MKLKMQQTLQQLVKAFEILMKYGYKDEKTIFKHFQERRDQIIEATDKIKENISKDGISKLEDLPLFEKCKTLAYQFLDFADDISLFEQENEIDIISEYIDEIFYINDFLHTIGEKFGDKNLFFRANPIL